MPIVKKRDHQTETRLLLEGDDSIELPPAEVEERNIIAQFDQYKAFIPELVETLRAGTIAEPVPVMNDAATFAVHTATRTFWLKLWHRGGSERTVIERVQIISCLPSTRGVQILPADMLDDDEFDEEYTDADEDEFDDEDELNSRTP
jgi:hypothetical protein